MRFRELNEVSLRGDTLFGVMRRLGRHDSSAAIPLSSLRTVATSRVSGSKTVAVSVFSLIGAFAIFLLLPGTPND